MIQDGGVRDMAARNDAVENEDVVVWHSFGVTHNPRTEGRLNFLPPILVLPRSVHADIVWRHTII